MIRRVPFEWKHERQRKPGSPAGVSAAPAKAETHAEGRPDFLVS